MSNRIIFAGLLVMLILFSLVQCGDDKSTGSDDEATTLDNRIVYSTRFDGLFLINSDGSGKKLLLDDDSCWATIWSPDKTRVAFLRTIPGLGRQIQVVDTTTSTVQYIAYGDFDYNPWSPDGNTLVYDHNNGISIKALGSDSSVPVLSDAIDAVFLNNDTLITLYSPSGNMDSTYLYRVAVDGSALTVLSDSSGYRYVKPRLSPDRTKIAYVRIPDTYADDFEIWLINVDGTGDELLAEIAHPVPCLTFSRDGANLFFVPNQGDDNKLYMLDIASKIISNLTGFYCGDAELGVDCAPDQNKLAVTLVSQGIGIVDYVNPVVVDTLDTLGFYPNW